MKEKKTLFLSSDTQLHSKTVFLTLVIDCLSDFDQFSHHLFHSNIQFPNQQLARLNITEEDADIIKIKQNQIFKRFRSWRQFLDKYGPHCRQMFVSCHMDRQERVDPRVHNR